MLPIFQKVLNEIPAYTNYLSVEEMRIRENRAASWGFTVKEVGKSGKGIPLKLISIGNGSRNVLVWGFPHPNEPVGALSVDAFIELLRKHKELQKMNVRWHFIYCADPDRARLNEGWFSVPGSLRKYFQEVFRPPAHEMIDWNFPVQKEDFFWDKSLPETKVIMDVIDEIKPVIMFPLHSTGFGGAYFLSTQDLGEAWRGEIMELCEKEGIPLHLGEPEEVFMKPFTPPFYQDITFDDYYQHTKKIGQVPHLALAHGDNSTGYLLRGKENALVIKGEIPMFAGYDLHNTQRSGSLLRDVYLRFLDARESHLTLVKGAIEEILKVLQKDDAFYSLIKMYKKRGKEKDTTFRNHVLNSEDFNKAATKADESAALIGGYFYGGGMLLGQVRRAALRARLSPNIIFKIDGEIEKCLVILTERLRWKPALLKSMVKTQLGMLFITLEKTGMIPTS